MTNLELIEKYKNCLILVKGVDLDAEANPELEKLLKEFQATADGMNEDTD